MILALLSGVALALTLPRPGVCALGWVALAPLIYAVNAAPRRRAFLLGWTGGAAFHAVAFYWIYSTCRFALVPAPVAALAWAALAAFQGLAWGVIALFARWAAQALPARLRSLGWAVAWTAVMVACERWTPRLPGDLLEYTQWRHPSLFQVAALGGPHALGFIVAWVNAALAQAWEESRGGEVEAASATPGLALSIALAAAAWGYGAGSLAGRPEPAGSGAARVEVLQPNVDQYRKWDAAYEQEIEKDFQDLLSAPRRTAPRLIVWPESALPRWVREGESPAEAALWSKRLGAAQVVGVVSSDAEGAHYNAAFYLTPDGALAGAYHKRELVPFGEYVPFPALRRFIGILNELGGITAGAADQGLFETPLGPAAVTICYEAVFPRWSRFDASRGARLIVNITNDGWYKDTWGPYQHFNTNVFRAVENRVTVIRAGNTGVSAVIDPWGQTLAREELGLRGRLDADVPLADAFPRRSLYARSGDWLGALMLALAAVMLAAAPGLNYGRD
jgi:apolipoprotein N-acyltransferase